MDLLGSVSRGTCSLTCWRRRFRGTSALHKGIPRTGQDQHPLASGEGGGSWPHVSVITHITSGGKTQQQNFLKAALVNCAGVFIYEGDLGDSTGANPIERRFSARFPKAPGRSMPCRASRSLTRGRDAEWVCVWTPSPRWEEATGLNMPYRVPGADVQVGGQWSGGL